MRGDRSHWSVGLMALGLLVLLGAPARGLQAAPVDSAHGLDDPDPEAARAAWERLRGQGAAAVPILCDDFGRAPVQGRRNRAGLLAEVAGADDIGRVIALLDDPDAEVRSTLVAFLARPDLAGAAIEPRVAALEAHSRDDVAGPVRRAAMRALGDLDEELAARALGRLARELPAPDRTVAARNLPSTPRASDVVRGLVADGFAPELPAPVQRRTPDDVLAEVLPTYGRMLADQLGGGESARDRAPLVIGLRHPSRAVQQAAGQAFRDLLARLRELGEADRAMRVLSGLELLGLEGRVVHYHRARFAFFPGGDPEGARRAAREIRDVRQGADGRDRRLWLFRSLYLEAMATLALEAGADVEPLFVEAAAVLDGLLAERMDRADESLRTRHVEILHQRALVEVARVVAALVAGTDASDRVLLERVRVAHRLTLEAQLGFAELNGEALSSWDTLLDSELSPRRLIFTGLDLPALSPTESLAVQAELGRALASVSPAEMPGFAPLPGLPPELTDPLQDFRRADLVEAILEARGEGLRNALTKAVAAAKLAQDRSPHAIAVEELSLVRDLRLQLNMIMRSLREDAVDILDVRVPSNFALWLAWDLRAAGRSQESRRIATRMRDELRSNGISAWWYYRGHERLAELERAIGNSWTEEDEPRRAEEELLKAVQRLEDIERGIAELGASPRQLQPYRNVRSGALVSLAVNANVKMGDPERALEYYERAYELRQDDFMRILLACYRARSGRDEEARALLREVRPYPQVYYNMACTHALLGDPARALEFLEKELEENHASDASRDRQRAWAQSDPDLASLRADPRFEQLVGLR